jgi:hypothetical protein
LALRRNRYTTTRADGSDIVRQSLANVCTRSDSGDVLDFTHDTHLCQVFADLLVAREAIAQAQQQEDLCKQTLQEKMGEASRSVFTAGEVSWKKNKAGSRRFVVHA